jgi:hypothetical protein
MRAVLAAIGIVSIVAIVGPAAASARKRPPIRSCGQIVFRVPHTGRQKYLYTESIAARRISCRQARAFLRRWQRLKLPVRAVGRTRRSVLVWNRWGRPYRAGAFVCRSMAIPSALFEPGRVTCGAPAGLVTWHETGHSHSG